METMIPLIVIYCIFTLVIIAYISSYCVVILADERLAVKAAALLMFWPITIPIVGLVFIWNDKDWRR